jgi:hypothetical protein
LMLEKKSLNNRNRRFLDSECFLKYLKPASEYYNPKKKPNTRPTLGLKKYPSYTWFKYPPKGSTMGWFVCGICCYSSQVCFAYLFWIAILCMPQIMYLKCRKILSKDAIDIWKRVLGNMREINFWS